VRIGSSGGTPVPNREIEAKSSGSGPVITYRLSPEELERVRRGERLEDVRKEDQPMTTVTEVPKAPDKLEVLRRLAAGWKISRIEQELGMNKGALHYWLGKWGLKGVKGEQAQRLLDELLIDQRTIAEPAAELEQLANSVAQELKDHELIDRAAEEGACRESGADRGAGSRTRRAASDRRASRRCGEPDPAARSRPG